MFSNRLTQRQTMDFLPLLFQCTLRNLAAFAADDYLSKDVVAAKGSGLAVRACVYNTAADKLFLHLHENFTRMMASWLFST